MARECVFCREPADSLEDALPLWLAELLKPQPGERAYHRMKGAYWEAGAFRAKVRRVCSRCNNGWMSNLETRAQPSLIPLIRGERTVIRSDTEKRALSTWALKTAMMLEFAKKGHESRIPPEHCRALRTYQRPSQQVSIWIGAIPQQERDGRSITLWQRATYRIDQRATVDPPEVAYFVAFFIGQLVFQLFGFFGGDDARLLYSPRSGGSLDDLALPLWPIREGDIEWPPSLLHSEATLRAFLEGS